LPRLAAWSRYTGNLPPLQMMVGWYLGYEKPKSASPKLTKEEHEAQLISSLMGGGMMR
jgi:hypothetical protein